MSVFSPELFKNPPSTIAPVYAWHWNSLVTKELIDTQLDEMASIGIRCVYPIPLPADFRPTIMQTRLKPGYLTEAFFDLVAYAAEAAAKRGMTFWLYDEGGWPSGSGRFRVVSENPDLMRTDLDVRPVRLEANVGYRPGPDVLAAFEKGTLTRVERGETRPENTELDEYFVAVRATGGLVQVLDRRGTELFIESVHEGYVRPMGKNAGTLVRHMFTDEPNAGSSPWPEDFAGLFAKRFGYDPMPFLPALHDAARAVTEEARLARIDYHTLCGELFRENYLLPIRDWCRRHGMISCGHLNNEDQPDGAKKEGYGSFLACLRRMDMPGIDLIWRQLPSPDQTVPPYEPAGTPFFPRIAASAARQIGKKESLSESFNIYGAGLTWSQMRYLNNYQYVRGVTMYNGMTVPTGRDRALALFMRPCFTPETPGIAHMAALNAMLTRTQYLLTLGIPAGETALYSPDRDFISSEDECRAAQDAFIQAGCALEKQGVDFDYIDDEAILSAEIEAGALKIGFAKYRTVIVPACRRMPEAVREKLALLENPDPMPVFTCTSPDIRARRFILDNGDSLYFAYNEGAERISAAVTCREDKPCYILNPETGDILSADHPCTLTLESGESRFLLFTNDALPVLPAFAPCAKWPLTAFTVKKACAYRIDDNGIRKDVFDLPFEPAETGSWLPRFGEGFSGEAIYRTVITPNADIRPGDRFRLNLGKVSYSARVFVNGQPAGIAAAQPFEVTFPAEKGELVIDIEVANTAANEVLSTDSFSHWPRTEVGVYHDRMLAFERDSVDGGLYGPVTLTLERA